MGGAVTTLEREGFAGSQLRVGLEEGVEGNEATGLTLTEDSDAARELLAHRICGVRISPDRQANGRRSGGVR